MSKQSYKFVLFLLLFFFPEEDSSELFMRCYVLRIS